MDEKDYYFAMYLRFKVCCFFWHSHRSLNHLIESRKLIKEMKCHRIRFYVSGLS